MGKVEVELEARLVAFVRQLRVDCDGNLPRNFDLHLEDIARVIGLSDAAIRRILDCEVLPGDRPLELAPTELGIAAFPEVAAEARAVREMALAGKVAPLAADYPDACHYEVEVGGRRYRVSPVARV